MANIEATAGSNKFSNAYNSRALFMITGAGDVELWLKDFNLPSVTMPVIETPHTPTPIKSPGNQMSFGNISANIFIDEDLRNHDYLFDWFLSAVAGPDFKKPNRYAKIVVLNNTLTKPMVEYVFSSMILTDLGEIQYNTYGAEPIIVPVVFSVDSMVRTRFD